MRTSASRLQHQDRALQREVLGQFAHQIRGWISDFATPRNLEMSQSAFLMRVAQEQAWAQNQISVRPHGEDDTHIEYRVEAVGAREYVARINGEEVWRGEAPDEALRQVITIFVAHRYLARFGSAP
jgi:hypothetical protein